MQKMIEFKPTAFDNNITPDGAENAFVLIGHNRDSGCLAESNWNAVIKAMQEIGDEGFEESGWEVFRFGHWSNGWFEILCVMPDTKAHAVAMELETRLENYPVLDEDDFSNREWEAKAETWKDCYDTNGRLEFLREYWRYEKDHFNSLSELLACIRTGENPPNSLEVD